MDNEICWMCLLQRVNNIGVVHTIALISKKSASAVRKLKNELGQKFAERVSTHNGWQTYIPNTKLELLHGPCCRFDKQTFTIITFRFGSLEKKS